MGAMWNLRGGFHRRIKFHPFPGRIVAGLEDNLHHFEVELTHADGVITDVQVRAVRYPWTTCADAPDFLRKQMTGRRFEELQELDIRSHCTHLYELVILCAAHAGDQVPLQVDLHVEDWQANRCTRVYLFVNCKPVLSLDVKNGVVETPGDWFGRDLFQPHLWHSGLDAAGREQAMLISRAIYVSMGRAAPEVQRAAERGPRVVGICFAYQPSRVGEAVKTANSRREFEEDFDLLLQDFTP